MVHTGTYVSSGLCPHHTLFLGIFWGAEGGLITCVRTSLILDEARCDSYGKGFGLAVTFSSNQGPISIFNVHVHPHWNPETRLSFFKDASRHIVRHPGFISFVLGDFNTVNEGEF